MRSNLQKNLLKVSDFVELALQGSQFQNVTYNRKYRKNVTDHQAEKKRELE